MLPPIDIVLSEMVKEVSDVVDAQVWQRVLRVLREGVVFYLHCGTPCNTFSSARKDDGGPPPLRSLEYPMGLPDLSPDNWCLVQLGNLFLGHTCEACVIVFDHGGDFSIENPLLSLMWVTYLMDNLIFHARALAIDLEQCAFGAPSRKPTRLECSNELFDPLAITCPGGHGHIKLKGKVIDPETGKRVFKTKAAQVYPWALCAAFASVVHALWQDPFQHLQASFQLVTPASDRKRQLGSCKPWLGHRQMSSAQRAQWAGYQLKRGAAKPLLHIEMEPGQAIEAALHVIHPFTLAAPLSAPEEKALGELRRPAHEVVRHRGHLLRRWSQIAVELLPQSVQAIRQLPDAPLRRLLLGGADHEPPVHGQVCHVALYAAMLDACQSVDRALPQLLLEGFPIVGEIARTGRWPAYDKPQKDIPVREALGRAWAIRRKIIQRVAHVPVTENLQKIWEASLEDVHECSCLGPFSHEAQVSDILGCEDWIPTQRFEVVQ